MRPAVTDTAIRSIPEMSSKMVVVVVGPSLYYFTGLGRLGSVCCNFGEIQVAKPVTARSITCA